LHGFLEEMGSVAISARRALEESLAPRVAIEKAFAQTGRDFRRHPRTEWFEDIFVKPLLKLGLGVTGLYARGMENAVRPVVRDLLLEFDLLPPAFDGYRLLHLSDLHLDSLPGLAESIMAVTAGLHVDAVLITGDYRFLTQGPCDQVCPDLRKILSGISSGDGMFGILGNHDSSEMAYALEALGVQMLINDAVPLARGSEEIWLAGLDDSYDYRTHDLPRALSEVPTGSYRVLMAHTPDLYAEASRAGIHLYLCGHTHAGQVRLPLIGSVVQNSDAPRAYTHGHWRHERMQGYTSAGLGCSMLPIRFNCPPEIVRLTLRRRPAVR
jgi:predicted MPP superfamily phosphohydrolase